MASRTVFLGRWGLLKEVWISTVDIFLADHLTRGREEAPSFADDVGSPTLAEADVAQPASSGPVPVSFQGVDLTEAVVEFDRPSSRRAPAARRQAA